MKMTPGSRALDKMFKRRDRYEIPEWQRGEVWTDERKRDLIDSILRGWKLPKLYFLKQGEDQYEVVDGQQRLSAIFEFFSNDLSLSEESVEVFGGPIYKDLKSKYSDAFDDFEIEYDEIENATVEEIKEFFQRLQQGVPLNSSEKLNSVHSKLRDFCRVLTKHDFFTTIIPVADTRFAHFDIAAKVASIEVEGIDTSLRLDDIVEIFRAQQNFSKTSAVAKRLHGALDFLANCFPKQAPSLKNRTLVQSVITLTCKLVQGGNFAGLEKEYARFIVYFHSELVKQVELGQDATDYDFIRFQKSINANVKGGPRVRQEVLLRKALLFSPSLASAFDSNTIVLSGLPLRVVELRDSIANHIVRLNAAYSSLHGADLFKQTTKNTASLATVGKVIANIGDYSNFIGSLYHIFGEGPGQRLDGIKPQSFNDINLLRTDLQHDVDHGKVKAAKAKKVKIGTTFAKYAGVSSPEVLEPERFLLVQVGLLSAIDLDLKNLPVTGGKA